MSKHKKRTKGSAQKRKSRRYQYEYEQYRSQYAALPAGKQAEENRRILDYIKYLLGVASLVLIVWAIAIAP